jgi:hypothetical protein
MRSFISWRHAARASYHSWGWYAPDAYEGPFECLITGPSSFTFQVAPNPGPATALGTASYDINLVDQYFDTTILVFRDGTQQFEVTDIPVAQNSLLLSGG